MASFSDGTTTTSYKYDENGIRTSKAVGGTTTSFLLDGTTILAQKTGSVVNSFYYDGNGKRIAFKHNGYMYYYVYNLQGDVTHILDAAGNVVGTYTYDAWGKITNLSSLTSIARQNPFRYRGYYYDTESGLYYLNSRYYNPEWGRFLNADDASLLGANGDFTSYNLFAYCGNNPIIRADDGGGYWHLVIGGVVGGIIGGVSAAISGGDAISITIASVAGIASGLLAASGAGVIAETIGSACISMTSNAMQQINSIINDKTGNTKFNVKDMLLDGAIGLACGALGGNGASYGNTKSICKSGVSLTKKILSGNGKQALTYYAKTAHRAGGDFVLSALKDSMIISSIGTAIITIKDYFKSLF